VLVKTYVRKYDDEYKIKRKISFIVFLLILNLFSLLNGNLGFFNIPIIIILLIWLFCTLRVEDLTVGENSSKNISRNGPMHVEYKLPINGQSQIFCPQCGSLIDRYIENELVYFCSYCGKEIKNIRT